MNSLSNLPAVLEATLLAPHIVLETDDAETVAMKLDALRAFEERCKGVIAQVRESARLRLDQIGPVTIGEMMWYSGHPKKTPKPKSLAETVHAILTNVGGDFQAFVKHLKSDPLSVSECRLTLGDAFDEHFVTEIGEKLEEDKFTPRKLMNANTRFMEYQQAKRAALAAHDAE